MDWGIEFMALVICFYDLIYLFKRWNYISDKQEGCRDFELGGMTKLLYDGMSNVSILARNVCLII